MTTTTIEIDALYPDGTACVGREVSVRLIDGGAGGSTDTAVIGDARVVRLDANGHAEVDLVPNEELTPAGTFYRLSLVGSVSNLVRNIEVPVSATPISWADNAIQVASPVPPTFTGVIPAEDIAVDLTDYASVGVTADNVQEGLEQAFAGLVALGSAGGDTDLAKHATVQAAARIAPATDFVLTAVPAQTVTAVERQAAGLGTYPYWPDGSIGFATIGATTYGFGAVGGLSARWVATPTELLGTVNNNNVVLTTDEAADYASGGPVYDIGGGKIIKLWHGEDHSVTTPDIFMSFYGLAVADTATPDAWTDLGRIITAKVGDTAEDAWHDLANSSMVVHDGYVYVFFSERTSARRGAFAVARATLSSVVTWATGGATAVFNKWYQGAWGQLGLGGDSSEILVGAPYPTWSAVIRMSGFADRFVLVWTSKLTSDADAGNRWAMYAALSEPGSVTEWGDPQELVAPTMTKLAYVTLADASSLNTHVSDAATVKLYLVSSAEAATTGGFVWDDAEVLVYDLTVYSGWVEPALVNSWVNASGAARYRRVGADSVEIELPAVTGGASGAAAFQLPAGLRPSAAQSFPTFSTANGVAISAAAVVVGTNGDVSPAYPDATKPIVFARFTLHTA